MTAGGDLVLFLGRDGRRRGWIEGERGGSRPARLDHADSHLLPGAVAPVLQIERGAVGAEPGTHREEHAQRQQTAQRDPDRLRRLRDFDDAERDQLREGGGIEEPPPWLAADRSSRRLGRRVAHPQSTSDRTVASSGFKPPLRDRPAALRFRKNPRRSSISARSPWAVGLGFGMMLIPAGSALGWGSSSTCSWT